MSEKKNYKDTLLMPKTEFPMRGNLGKKEPGIQEAWEDNELYENVLKKNQNKPLYVLHDGPPYANGSIHSGTALNKVLKDFVVRYKNMSGFKAPYIPGWDTHGLPIENSLSKSKHVDRKSMAIPEFRERCKSYALEQIDVQKKQFKRLGVLGQWDEPYLTLNQKYEAAQVRMFGEMVAKGLIYKGLKPVYWSPSSESALAEAEIEYHDVTSPSIYVAMPVKKTKGVVPKNTELLIWTTTPWTIPANMAIAVGHDLEYALVKTDKNRLFLMARDLVDKLRDFLGYEKFAVQRTMFGWELEGLSYIHPLYNRESPVILGEHVTVEEGTGLVHTAPGHGEDDFVIGKKYDLEVFCPVDSKGFMTDDAGDRFAGLFVDDCNGEVIKALEEKDVLLKVNEIIHSYPHDWRTKKPVIFRATPQWFASIEDLKNDILKEIQSVKWYPSWGEVRLSNMIKDRDSWCISRQRTWGVPIPAFYTEKGTPFLDKDVIDHIANIFEEEGTNAWFEKSAEELLPDGFTHPDSPNGVFEKETDIMDVWFDSGSSHHGALIELGQPYPADLYLEGSDQYRGWFNSSMITGVATKGESPYKTLVSHGFVLDGEGRKMSKSMGNVVDPNKIIDRLGADIFRMWVASVDYQSDVRLSDHLIKQVSESYRKIRNTVKFILGNLNDFDHNQDRVSYDELGEVDRYIMQKANRLVEESLHAYDTFSFDDVYRKTTYFVTMLSSFYLDYAKDILYIEAKENHARRAVQTALYDVLNIVLKLLAPIIPHTTSEAYAYIPNKKTSDVYLTDMPKSNPVDETLLDKYDRFMNVREEVLKALETARNNKVIGKSLNAHVVLFPKNDTLDLLQSIEADLAQLFIVSKLELRDEGFGAIKGETMSIDVLPAEGIKCERCWRVVDHVHEEDGLCERCHEVVNNLE